MNKNPSPVTLTGLCWHYLLALRSIAFGTQCIATVAAFQHLEIPVPWLPLALVLATLALVTHFSWRRIGEGPVSENFFQFQLLADVLALAVLLAFTGGSANPFVSLLLLPVTVAAATLSSARSWIVAVAAALCYSGLLFFYRPDPHWDHGAGVGFALHMWGMWFGFLLSAGLVVYFVARMGAALREHDKALARARERELQNEQLVALGSLAAGTAHELGTPLATMAVLSKDLQNEYRSDPVLGKKFGMLRAQLYRCKNILAQMAVKAGQTQADMGRRQRVDEFLEDLLDEWHATRPKANINRHLQGTEPVPEIAADRTLSQALMNILNNAADASLEAIEFAASWDSGELQIAVTDYGGGLAKEVQQTLERPFVTTKAPGEGMGLGIYLARATLNRLGGTVQLNNRSGSGVTAEITIPLAPLVMTG